MDINEQIESNLGIVYQQLGRFKLLNNPDAESLAYEALYNAVLTYKVESGNKFSTYATCVVSNALRMYLRHIGRKKQLSTVSYYEHVVQNDEDSGYLLDTLKHVDDTESYVMLKELRGEVGEAWSRVFDTIPVSHKPIVLMWYRSDFKATQHHIATELKVSQATVSKALSAFKYKLKTELEEYL